MSPLLRVTHPNMSLLVLMLRVAEPIAVIIAALVAYWLRHGFFMVPFDYLLLTVFAGFCFSLMMSVMGGYRLYNIQRLIVNLPKMMGALAIALAFVVSILFSLKVSSEFSRLWIAYWAVLALIGLIIMRFLAERKIRHKLAAGKWRRRLAIYGMTAKTHLLLDALRQNNTDGLVLTGLYAQADTDVSPDMLKSGIYRGNLDNLLGDGLAGFYDDLIVTDDITATENAEILLNNLHKLAVNVFYCLPTALFGRVQHYLLIPSVPLVQVYHKPLEGHSIWLKRAMDIAASGTVLLIAAPVMCVVAILIKLSSPGPVFFRQKRGGFNGHDFEMLKFRSMRSDMPAPTDDFGKEKQATKTDPRITAIGKFIRRTSLDELPQLINVIKGDMSLVGPRPHVPSHNTYYEQLIDKYASRHKMRPGLTGWAQLNGWRGETETIDKMAKRVEFDIWYIENWSLALDLRIIILTPLVLLWQRGAY